MRASSYSIVATLALYLASPHANAATYSINGDFINNGDTTAPGAGVWAYGWSDSLGGSLHAFNTLSTQTGTAGNIVQSWTDSGNDSLGDPTVWNNTSGSEFNLSSIVIPNGWTMFHPGNNLELTNIEFIAPNTGAYAVNASFAAGDTHGGAGVDVYVATFSGSGANTLYGSLITGGAALTANGAPANPATYSGVVNLSAGEVLDFAVYGNGASPAYSDSTLLQGFIAPVPLPSALWLMLPGLGGLSAMIRKRKDA